MIKPKALQKGDRVATISTSWGGPNTFPDRYNIGKKQLEDCFGVTVIETEHALKSANWLYNNPKARADDLMNAFKNPDIKGIISTIGGDESVRILPYIDTEVIRQNPKVFMGYSDTTISHLICYKAGLTSFYGPSIMAGFGENGGLFPYMEQSVRKAVFSTEPMGIIKPNEGWTVETLDWGNSENQKIKRKLIPSTGPKILQGQGKVQGHLLGGCAEVLEMIKGTDYWPSLNQWADAILFLETSEEAPDVGSFTRWIRNYGSQGILHAVNGIILARPGGDIPIEDIARYDEALQNVIKGELGLNTLPIMTNMDFGHTDPMFVIPYGVKAEIDCDKAQFTILESAVTA